MCIRDRLSTIDIGCPSRCNVSAIKNRRLSSHGRTRHYGLSDRWTGHYVKSAAIALRVVSPLCVVKKNDITRQRVSTRSAPRSIRRATSTFFRLILEYRLHCCQAIILARSSVNNLLAGGHCLQVTYIALPRSDCQSDFQR